MPTVTATAVLNAPPAHVWALLRDFAGIGGWHPFLPPVRVEGGPADRVGLPVRDYVSTLSVTAAGDGALVTWSSRYDCDAADEPAVVAQVRDGILRPGLAALTDRFAATEVAA
jgi:hypothetical protein